MLFCSSMVLARRTSDWRLCCFGVLHFVVFEQTLAHALDTALLYVSFVCLYLFSTYCIGGVRPSPRHV